MWFPLKIENIIYVLFKILIFEYKNIYHFLMFAENIKKKLN